MRSCLLVALVVGGTTVALANQNDSAPLSAPALQLHTVAGEPSSLADSAGNIVVVNFWATWCLPCREELPMLESLAREYAKRGVEFVAASVDAQATQDRIPDAISQAGVTFDVWVGATGADMHRFDVGTELPATAIVDRDRSIAFRLRGPLTDRMLRERLDWLIGERSAEKPGARVDAHAKAADQHDAEHGDHDGHAHGDGDACCAHDADTHDDDHDDHDHGDTDDHHDGHAHGDGDGDADGHADADAHADHHDHGHDHDHDHGDGDASAGDASLVPS
jgi:thiol-disulfide isomerase/thioredoxin